MEHVTPDMGKDDFYVLTYDMEVVHCGHRDDFKKYKNSPIIENPEGMKDDEVMVYLTGEELHLLISEIAFKLKHMEPMING